MLGFLLVFLFFLFCTALYVLMHPKIKLFAFQLAMAFGCESCLAAG